MNRFLSKKNNNNKKMSEKMDFPELIVSKKKPIVENETYKNVIKKEVEVKKESLPEGFIVLKEGNIYSQKKSDKQEDDFLENIISTQEYLDKVHDKYRENFIELHGEDLYDKYYTMTESHIYIEKEEEEEDEELV
jgi:methionyl-tRNA formyltransferase